MSYKTQKKDAKKIKSKKDRKIKSPKDKRDLLSSLIYTVVVLAMLGMGLTMVFAWSHYGTDAYNKTLFISGIVLIIVGGLGVIPLLIGIVKGFAEGLRTPKSESKKPKK